jgi:hypothetical protein
MMSGIVYTSYMTYIMYVHVCQGDKVHTSLCKLDTIDLLDELGNNSIYKRHMCIKSLTDKCSSHNLMITPTYICYHYKSSYNSSVSVAIEKRKKEKEKGNMKKLNIISLMLI